MNDFQFLEGEEVNEITRLFEQKIISNNLYIAAINMIGQGYDPKIILSAVNAQVTWKEQSHD